MAGRAVVVRATRRLGGAFLAAGAVKSRRLVVREEPCRLKALVSRRGAAGAGLALGLGLALGRGLLDLPHPALRAHAWYAFSDALILAFVAAV